MCAHCGCGQPRNKHGNQDSITVGEMEKAMRTAAHQDGGKDVHAATQEMKRMVRRGRRGAANGN